MCVCSRSREATDGGGDVSETVFTQSAQEASPKWS